MWADERSPALDAISPPRSCVVVGAGPAGLSAAWALRSRGVRTIVLEQDDVVGGRTRSTEIDGSTLNLGAAFLASFYDQTLTTCRLLGVPMAAPAIHPTRAGPGRLMVTPRGPIPYAPGRALSFARFRPVPARQRVKLARELVRLARGPALHIADPATLAAADRMDAQTWALSAFGKEASDYFVRPAIEPFFYMNAHDVSAAVARALLRHAVSWSLVTPAKGMGSLCAALTAQLDVRLRSHVRGIAEHPDGVVVSCDDGSVHADAAVIAVPAPDLLTIDGAAVTDAERAAVAGARFEPCVLALLGYNGPVALPAPSVTVGGAGRHALVGVTALSQGGVPGHIRTGAEVVSVLAMGWRSRSLLGRDDEAVVDELRKEMRRLGVNVPRPAWHQVVAREHATAIPEPGFTRRLRSLAAFRRARTFLAGDWLTGISTVEGAVRSGQAAARAVLAVRA